MHRSLIALVSAAGIGIAAMVAPAPANADCVGCAIGAGILGGVPQALLSAPSRRPAIIGPRHRIDITRTEEEDGAGNCAKRAFTRKNWARLAWAIAAHTGNFADSAAASTGSSSPEFPPVNGFDGAVPIVGHPQRGPAHRRQHPSCRSC
jgi:hypothetical protein